MSNFITKSCCKLFNIIVADDESSVQGIELSVRPVKGKAQFTFCSRYDKRLSYSVEAFVLNKITDDLPSAILEASDLKHLHGLPLADDTFGIPGKIDGIIGTEIFPYLLGSKHIITPASRAVGIETTLGYIVMGASYAHPSNGLNDSLLINNNKSFLCTINNNLNLDTLVRNFWEVENITLPRHISSADAECEKLFVSTYSRNRNGRYSVKLPFKEDPSLLGDSARTALKRFNYLEKRFIKQPDIRIAYNETIRNYINNGYLSLVTTSSQISQAPHFYIPHHAVYRPDKTTSKVRIVLDASCKSSSGKSLNDILHCGANLQSNIFDILLNLRLFPVTLAADIEKMYFQIALDKEYHRYQRIFYRFDINEPISTYEFTRVSFGMKVSPFLALRVVQQLVEDEKEKYPLAAMYMSKSMYMDDYINSFPSLDLAKEVYSQLTSLFASGCFKLTKWISNSPHMLNHIPSSDRSPQLINFDENADTKVVGLQWFPLEDHFSFQVKSVPNCECTKRNILAHTARYYDPLGLIGPVVAFMKLLVQECWKADLDWDDPAPPFIVEAWTQFLVQIELIKEIKIPRHIGIYLSSHVTLIGFSDASEKCYGAAIYVRVSVDPNSLGETALLCSKSRLAPLKKLSLARLELCAAHLLSDLICQVRDNIKSRCEIANIYAFSDSSVTLSWIHSEPYRWQTFISNRVALIHANLDASHWYHIAGSDNPSDILSRPTIPGKLVNNNLWFKGPDWTVLPTGEWPVSAFVPSTFDKMPELKSTPQVLVSLVTKNEHIFYEIASRVSSWRKLCGVVVYILRFTRKLRSRGPITAEDTESAEFCLFRCIQADVYSNDITALTANKEVSQSLRKLNPFLDDGLLRVGGRLEHAQLSFGQKHPLILPANDRIVCLLIRHYHEINLHTGPNLVMSLLRQRFWIVNARRTVRKIIHNCNICFRNKPRQLCPIMGQQPSFRVNPQLKCFVETGVDYAGPLLVTMRKLRGVKSQKAYICIFVCLATKAIHIELVSDLSTEMFINAFKRFICRRGPVSVIHSDRGTNFICAKRKIDELYNLLASSSYNSDLIRELTANNIKFKFNPPLSPHMGGIWETAVRSVKLHLFRVIGSQVLTYEEMNTVLIQIEALLNSRPLCVLSSDPSEPLALTPAHFLCSTPLKWLPSKDLINKPQNRLQRFELLDSLVQSYWQRWSLEYVNSLLPRGKWYKSSPSVQPGTVVLIKDDNNPPLHWPLGVIQRAYPGSDGVTRVVDVKTKTGVYKRPVVRICPLPTQ